MDFYEMTGFPCRATIFYNASPACSMVEFSLWFGLEDPEDWVVLDDQLLQRFVPEGCFSVQQVQCSVLSCGAEGSNFWLATKQFWCLIINSLFKEILSLSHGVLNVKFAIDCVIKLRPALIFHSAPSYWLSHLNLLKMVPFIILTRRCQVDIFQTGLKCLKLFSIIMAWNIFKDNLATFHRSERSFRRNSKFRCFT